MYFPTKLLKDVSDWVKGTGIAKVSVDGIAKVHVDKHPSMPFFHGIYEPDYDVETPPSTIEILGRKIRMITYTTIADNPNEDKGDIEIDNQGNIYTGNSYLTKIDLTGTIIWQASPTNRISSIKIHKNSIYTGEEDGTLTKYEIDTGVKIWTEKIHDDEITEIDADITGVYTSSKDGTAKKYDHDGVLAWEYPIYEETENPTGYDGEINTIKAFRDEIYIGGNNGIMKLSQTSADDTTPPTKSWYQSTIETASDIYKIVVNRTGNPIVAVSGKVVELAKFDGSTSWQNDDNVTEDRNLAIDNDNNLYRLISGDYNADIIAINQSGDTMNAIFNYPGNFTTNTKIVANTGAIACFDKTGMILYYETNLIPRGTKIIPSPPA